MVTLAALVPVAAVSLWARQTLVDEARAQDERRLERTVRAAKARVDERAATDRRIIDRLCERDFVVDRLLLDLSADRFDTPRRDDLVQLLPPMMRSLGLDTLSLIHASPSAAGEILAAGHYPGRAGASDRPLLRAAERAGAKPFLRELRVRRGGQSVTEEVLLTACLAERGSAKVLVVGGRFLSHAVSDLASDVDAITVVLERAEDQTDKPLRREFHTFKNADGEPQARLAVLVDDTEFRAQLRTLDQGFLIGAGAAIALALCFGLLLAWGLNRPLADLEEAAERVGSGDLQSTVGEGANNEIGRALRAFNRMTHDLRATQEKLLRAERIAAWRDIARRIAHEVKNPLSPIQVAIETMQKTYRKRHPDFEEIFEESTTMILEEVRKLTRLVTEFSSFARMPSPKSKAIDPTDLVQHIASLYRSDSTALEVQIDGELPIIRGDRDQLSEVFTNLTKNAIEAAKASAGADGAKVRIEARAVRGGVEVRIGDNGPGIPADQRLRVFEPYFTTKSEGTGLGLSIVHRIVTDHDGSIEVATSDLGGAEFVVFLSERGPMVAATASATDAPMPLVRRRD